MREPLPTALALPARATLRDHILRSPTGRTLAILGAVVVAVMIAVFLNLQANARSAMAMHAVEVTQVAERLVRLGVDAETGQRGYLLTGNRRFLEPYDAARIGLGQHLDELRALVADNPSQLARLDEVQVDFDRKLSLLARAIDLAELGQREAALATISESADMAVMDGIRNSLSILIGAERALVTRRMQDAERSRLWGGLAILVILLGLGLLVRQEIARQRAARDEAHSNITRLERLVQDRTAGLLRQTARVEAMMADVTHRVGNNLSMISALLNLQIRQSSNPEVTQALSAAVSRIQAIAVGHRKLVIDTQTDQIDGKPYVENLLADLQATAVSRNVQIIPDLMDVRIPGRDAVSYVILINEIVTNALKHAFPDGMSGTIRVQMAKVGREDDDLLEIVITDDGIGIPQGGAATGLGSRIIAMLLVGLSGEMDTTESTPGDARPGCRVRVRLQRG